MLLPFSFTVPEEKKIRLVINTDAKNEADDQYAIVHALLTQKFCVKGVIAAHFGEARTKTSMEESFAEIQRVLGMISTPGSSWRISMPNCGSSRMRSEKRPG
jgi:hypothetical protein